MTVNRTLFDVSTDTGQWWQDTGPVIEGPVLQVMWLPTAGADTGGGADLQLELVNSSDTGAIATICVVETVLTSARRQFVFKQQTYDTGGAISSEEFVFGAGERLRAKVTPSGEITTGKLYVDWGL